MKMVKVKFSIWVKLIKKLREYKRANTALNKQLEEYKQFIKEK